MVKIITDSSSLYSVSQAKELGFDVTPLLVTIDNVTYRENEEICSKEFNDKVISGSIPTSSQPAVGEVLELMEKYKDEDTLVVSMADGLSGTYASAVGARATIENNQKIKVINTRTLCGPHNHIIDVITKLNNEGSSIDKLIYEINLRSKSTESFLIPFDFDFLKRGGRLTPIAATIVGLLKIVPALRLVNDGKKLDTFTKGRTYDITLNKIIAKLIELETNKDYIIYIAHAFNEEKANIAKEKIEKAIEGIEVRVVTLSPAFITQGGPGCIAIQSVLR